MKLVLFANRLWILHKDNATSAWHRRSWQLVAGMSTSSETRCGRTLCICLYTLFIMISHCIFYAMYCYIHIYIMYIFIQLYYIYMCIWDMIYLGRTASSSTVQVYPKSRSYRDVQTCFTHGLAAPNSTEGRQGSMGPLAKVIQRCSKRW